MISEILLSEIHRRYLDATNPFNRFDTPYPIGKSLDDIPLLICELRAAIKESKQLKDLNRGTKEESDRWQERVTNLFKEVENLKKELNEEPLLSKIWIHRAVKAESEMEFNTSEFPNKKSHLERSRQTGRTNRMILQAMELAEEGKTVYILVASIIHKNSIVERLGNNYPNIKVETFETLSDFDFRTMELNGIYPDCVVLCDHYTIEKLYGPMLDELYAYDI